VPVQLRFQQSKGVDGSSFVPLMLLSAVVNVIHADAVVAICTALAIFTILFVQSFGASCAAVSFEYGLAFLNGRHTATSNERCTEARQRLLHLSLRARDAYRRLPSMPISRSLPGTVLYDHGACSGRYPSRVRRPLHVQAHAVPFDRGFAEYDVLYDESNNRREIQAGEQVEIFRSVYAPFAHIRDACFTKAIAAVAQVRIQHQLHANTRHSRLGEHIP
jgi:hypothetical protein